MSRNGCPCEFCADDVENNEPQVTPEPDATWRDHLDYARDYLQDADRYCADDTKQERKRRLEILESAAEQIAAAKALLNGGAR